MDSFFFYAAKLAWLLVSPGNLLVLLLCLSLLLQYRKAFRAALILQTFLCILVLPVAFLPVGEWLLFPLENRFPSNPQLPEQVTGIIVLSGGEKAIVSEAWNQVELNEGAERNLAFLHLARRYPCARLIFTGGSGSLTMQQHKEADVARRLFREQGLDEGRVVFERNSRNTYENGLFSRELVRPKAGENWILVTTAWHMPRAVGVFRKLGWNVLAYPVDHRGRKHDLLRLEFDFSGNLDLLGVGLKEWLGLAVYYVAGKGEPVL